MGFYGLEPFDEAKATYVWTGIGGPGFFAVEVKGAAPNYTYGIQLVRDLHWVGGLKVDVMGWTGPLGEGKTPYTVYGSFPGEYRDAIVVHGSNGSRVIKVGQIPQEQAEDYMKSLGATGSA
jgi:hypothetical protein